MTIRQIVAEWTKFFKQKGDCITKELKEALEYVLIDDNGIVEGINQYIKNGEENAAAYPIGNISFIYGRFMELSHGDTEVLDETVGAMYDYIKDSGSSITPEKAKAACTLLIYSTAAETCINSSATPLDLAFIAVEKFNSLIVQIQQQFRENDTLPKSIADENDFIKSTSAAIKRCGFKTYVTKDTISVECNESAIFVIFRAKTKPSYIITSLINGECTHKRFPTENGAIEEIQSILNELNRIKVQAIFEGGTTHGKHV